MTDTDDTTARLIAAGWTRDTVGDDDDPYWNDPLCDSSCAQDYAIQQQDARDQYAARARADALAEAVRAVEANLAEMEARLASANREWATPGYVRDAIWDGWDGERHALTRVLRLLRALAAREPAGATGEHGDDARAAVARTKPGSYEKTLLCDVQDSDYAHVTVRDSGGDYPHLFIEAASDEIDFPLLGAPEVRDVYAAIGAWLARYDAAPPVPSPAPDPAATDATCNECGRVGPPSTMTGNFPSRGTICRAPYGCAVAPAVEPEPAATSEPAATREPAGGCGWPKGRTMRRGALDLGERYCDSTEHHEWTGAQWVVSPCPAATPPPPVEHERSEPGEAGSGGKGA